MKQASSQLFLSMFTFFKLFCYFDIMFTKFEWSVDVVFSFISFLLGDNIFHFFDFMIGKGNVHFVDFTDLQESGNWLQ